MIKAVIDSQNVLSIMKAVYTLYLLAVLSLVGLFAFAVTRKKKIQPPVKIPFYGWIALLVCTGVGLHLLTLNTIPWVKWELSEPAIDQKFAIEVADYQFRLPAPQLLIEEGQTVEFDVVSRDYTYGFGIFRPDGSMVFQMQVVPGHDNRIVWVFDRSGTYSIRSTEYSGPRGASMLVENAVVVHASPGRTKITSIK